MNSIKPEEERWKRAVTIRDESFFRPKQEEEEKGGEKFLRIVKKAIRVAFQLLLLSFFLFCWALGLYPSLGGPLFSSERG